MTSPGRAEFEFGPLPVVVTLSEAQQQDLTGTIDAMIEQWDEVAELERRVKHLHEQADIVSKHWALREEHPFDTKPKPYEFPIATANQCRAYGGAVLRVAEFSLPFEAELQSRDPKIDLATLKLGGLSIDAIHVETKKILASSLIDEEHDGGDFGPLGLFGLILDPHQAEQEVEAWRVPDSGRDFAIFDQFSQYLIADQHQ